MKISELFAVFDAHPELAHGAKKLQGFSRPDEGLAEVLRIG